MLWLVHSTISFMCVNQSLMEKGSLSTLKENFGKVGSSQIIATRCSATCRINLIGKLGSADTAELIMKSNDEIGSADQYCTPELAFLPYIGANENLWLSVPLKSNQNCRSGQTSIFHKTFVSTESGDSCIPLMLGVTQWAHCRITQISLFIRSKMWKRVSYRVSSSDSIDEQAGIRQPCSLSQIFCPGSFQWAC